MAAGALAMISPVAEPAVPQLERMLDAKNPPAVRMAGAEALRAIGDRAYAAVPALIRALDDPNPAVVQTVCGALGEHGRLAAGAVPRLERLAEGHSATGPHALCALNRISNDNWAVRWEAAEARSAWPQFAKGGAFSRNTLTDGDGSG